MENIETITNLVANYSLLIVIAVIYIWDNITNKTKTKELEEKNNEILQQNSACLKEVAKSNTNIAKSLEILEKNTTDTNRKVAEIDKNVLIIKSKIEGRE